MSDYADARTLMLLECEDPRYSSTLEQITILDLPTEEVTSHDEIPQKVLELIDIINQQEDEHIFLGNFTIDDKRSINYVGASSALQEVIVAITTGVTGSASTILIQQLMTWCAGKYRKIMTPERRLDVAISSARDLVVRQFNPQGILEVLETSTTESTSKIRIKDSQGTHYEIKMQHTPPYATQAKKIRSPKVDK